MAVIAAAGIGLAGTAATMYVNESNKDKASEAAQETLKTDAEQRVAAQQKQQSDQTAAGIMGMAAPSTTGGGAMNDPTYMAQMGYTQQPGASPGSGSQGGGPGGQDPATTPNPVPQQ